MSVPLWHALAQGGTLSSSDLNQFLGDHPASFLYFGVSKVSYIVAGSANANTNTGAAAQWLAQPFTTAGGQTTITRIELNLQAVGTGADTTLELRTDNAGVPSNTVLWSCVIPADFQGAAAYISIPCNVSGLSAATKYHIVLDGTASTSNICRWNSAVTSVNAGLVSASGSAGWSSAGKTFLFNVYNGTNSVVRHIIEDGTTSTTGGVTQTNGAPAKWSGYDWTVAATANALLTTVREYCGALRSVRTLSYTSGVLTGVA